MENQINKNLVNVHFSRKADRYDEHAKVQKKTIARLKEKLEDSNEKKYQYILEIGCGTGELSLILLEMLPNAIFFINDISPDMLRLAEKKIMTRFPHLIKQIYFILGDAENFSHNLIFRNAIMQATHSTNSNCQFDLIVSANTLQWFNQPQQALSYYFKELLKDGGRLIFTLFAEHTFRELRAARLAAESYFNQTEPKPMGQRLFSLQAWVNILESSFNKEAEYKEEYYLREEYSDCRAFLQAIKDIGANNANQEYQQKINRKILLKTISLYDEMFNANGGVYATYHVVNISIIK